MWRSQVTRSFLLKTPAIWVYTDSTGAQQFHLTFWVDSGWPGLWELSVRAVVTWSFCSKPLKYGCLQTPLKLKSQDLVVWAELWPPGHWGHQGYMEVTSSFCSKTLQNGRLQTPLDPRFGNLVWLRTTWTLRVCRGHFVFLFKNLNNMDVYGLPYTPAVKIWRIDLDHLDTEDTQSNESILNAIGQHLRHCWLWELVWTLSSGYFLEVNTSTRTILVTFFLRACSSKGRNGIPGRNISSWGRKSDLKICPEAETIRPKMTIRPLDEQAQNVPCKVHPILPCTSIYEN